MSAGIIGHSNHSRTRIGFPQIERREYDRGSTVHAALGPVCMKTIRSYSLQSEADVARIALASADIPAVVVGVGIGMKGGALLVPEGRIEAALKILKDLEERR